MEFWGVEVKPGETVKCDPGENRYLHLSQASLGETKKDKGSENVPLFVKFDDQKLVLGTLSGEKCAQIQYDLVFEKELELSHSSKNASVYFCGYKTTIDEHDHDELDGYSDFDSEEEDFQLGQGANGKASLAELGKTKVVKADVPSDKPKAKAVQALKADKPKVDEDDDNDDDDSDEEDSDEDSDGLGMDDEEDDSDEDEEEDDGSDEEETPKKVEIGKKRAAGSGPKTPVPEKKAKLVSPVGGQKTGGDSKKSGHTATPHPAKKVGKTPANEGKSKQPSPKSGGSVTCKSCSKTFNSDNALQAHSKAKHSAAK